MEFKGKPNISNITELAIWMESVKNGLGLKTDHLAVGAQGLKVQVEKQKQGNYKNFQEAMYVFYVPVKNEKNELELELNSIWIDKTTGEVIEEPEWFKEQKNEKSEA